ncbi:GbsR/MarR family transcriptional regulator [Rathayibacter sp. KR2-224]|uniref:GbsR/MarR family transcriptional regulator n=1 Tax=Rathayibacter sp. KR2-224 TaxID=3400913 RepID=UPI003C06CDBC
MERDEARLRDYAERAAAILTTAGFPRMPSRVLFTLTVAETGLTAAELAERLDASAAAISGAVRYLQGMAMVRRVSQPGSRRDVYELPDNAWYSAGMSEQRFYASMLSLTEGIPDAAGGPDTAVGARIVEMAGFFDFLRQRLPELLAEWESVRRPPSPSDR